MAQDFDDLQDSVAFRLWDNDESVLEDLLRMHAPALEHCLLEKYAPALNAYDIEDVVAFAVMQLWETRAKYDDKKAKIFTYLYVVADHKAIDILRNGWADVGRESQVDDGDLFTQLGVANAPGSETPKSVAQLKLLQDTREAFAKLPEIQGQLLFAKAMAGDGEITSSVLADENCLPESTVRVYLMRARDAMRAELRRRGHSL